MQVVAVWRDENYLGAKNNLSYDSVLELDKGVEVSGLFGVSTAH